MAHMKAYINNQAHPIIAGETLLQFVRRIEGEKSIPTICHAKNLQDFGSCRLCSVDIARSEGGDRKVVASCHTPVTDGMYIYPHSERIQKLRKNIMELVLSQYPEDQLVEDAGMRPTEFQDTIRSFGEIPIRYPKKSISEVIDKTLEKDHSHPYIHADFEQCIHCYRCVRACDEVQGQFVLSMMGRGISNHIIIGADVEFATSDCVSCGACVQTCPTGALSDRYQSKTQAFDRSVQTICTYCGVGCNLDVHVRDGEVVGIEAPLEAKVNAGHTCLKGRYAWKFYRHPDRLDSPLIRKNGVLEKATWDEAFRVIVDKLSSIKESFGPDAIAGISSSRCTNEENYLMQKFFRIVIGTNNIDGCARVCHAPTAYGMQKAFGTGAATNSIADLEHTDCLFVIGANPTHAHPVTGAKMKQLAMKGTTLIVVDPIQTELAKYATFHVALKPGTNVAFLNLMAYYIVSEGWVDDAFISKRTDGYQAFERELLQLNPDRLEAIIGVDKAYVREVAKAYATASNAMEFHGLGVTEHYQGSRTVMLLANLAMMTGNIGRPGVGMNPLRGQNNVQGAADMGVQPNQGAGYLEVTSPEVQAYYHAFYQKDHPSEVGLKIPEMFEACRSGQLKAMWIMGEDVLQTDPNTCQIEQAIGQLDFLIVQEIFMTETAAKADVVLPASSFLEKEGTFTNGERRVQRVNRVVEPLQNTKPDGQIIVEVMRAMGYDQPDYSAPEVLREIAGVVPFFKGITWDRLGKNGLQWPVFEDGSDTQILHQNEFKKGRGKLHFFDFSDSPELLEHREKFPFILTTGRILEHYNCGTMTRRTPNGELVKADVLLINPVDAERKSLKTGDWVNLFSDRGNISIVIEVSSRVQEGVLFTTFHFPEVGINYITSSVHDTESMTPEYKVVAVDIKKITCHG